MRYCTGSVSWNSSIIATGKRSRKRCARRSPSTLVSACSKIELVLIRHPALRMFNRGNLVRGESMRLEQRARFDPAQGLLVGVGIEKTGEQFSLARVATSGSSLSYGC